MLVTDKHAIVEMFCPFQTVSPGGPIGRCLGASCMQWRWAQEVPLVKTGKTITKADPKQGGKVVTVDEAVDAPERRVGYCGMSGRPAWEK